jgi:hypothetical protein
MKLSEKKSKEFKKELEKQGYEYNEGSDIPIIEKHKKEKRKNIPKDL